MTKNLHFNLQSVLLIMTTPTNVTVGFVILGIFTVFLKLYLKYICWEEVSLVAGEIYMVFNLKVDRYLSHEYITSDAIYNGSAGMTLYYYMCRSWQDCCRRGENRSWPSVSVEAVNSKCWCLNNAIVYTFIMWLTVEERLESFLKTMSYIHCRQSFFWKIWKASASKKCYCKND